MSAVTKPAEIIPSANRVGRLVRGLQLLHCSRFADASVYLGHGVFGALWMGHMSPKPHAQTKGRAK